MLSKPDATPVFEGGKFVGVSSEGQTVKAKLVVGDPSYFPERVQRTGRVVRAICIMNHPIPSTDNSHSVQIILPQKQVRAASRRSLLAAGRLPAAARICAGGTLNRTVAVDHQGAPVACSVSQLL